MSTPSLHLDNTRERRVSLDPLGRDPSIQRDSRCIVNLNFLLLSISRGSGLAGNPKPSFTQPETIIPHLSPRSEKCGPGPRLRLGAQECILSLEWRKSRMVHTARRSSGSSRVDSRMNTGTAFKKRSALGLCESGMERKVL